MKDISPRTDPSFWSNWVQSPLVLDTSRSRRFRPALAEYFREVLGISANSKVLEIGCGPGTWTRFAARYLAPSGMAWGIDRDAAGVEYAKRRAADDGLSNAHFRIADACELPFEDGFFDAVTSYTVLEHIADTARFLDEQIRVCARGGTVAVMGVETCARGPCEVMPTEGRIAELLRRLSSLTSEVERQNGFGAGVKVSEIAPWLERRGLREIRIDGLWQPFCLLDARYEDSCADILEREFVGPIAEFANFLVERHPDLLGPNTITAEELRELAALYAQFYRDRLATARTTRTEWIISDQPSLIVSGRRP